MFGFTQGKDAAGVFVVNELVVALVHVGVVSSNFFGGSRRSLGVRGSADAHKVFGFTQGNGAAGVPLSFPPVASTVGIVALPCLAREVRQISDTLPWSHGGLPGDALAPTAFF